MVAEVATGEVTVELVIVAVVATGAVERVVLGMIGIVLEVEVAVAVGVVVASGPVAVVAVTGVPVAVGVVASVAAVSMFTGATAGVAKVVVAVEKDVEGNSRATNEAEEEKVVEAAIEPVTMGVAVVAERVGEAAL